MLKEEEAYHACRLIDGCLLKEKHAGMCIFPFIERGRRPSATQEEEIVPKPRKRKAALSFATPAKEATAPGANPKLPVAVEEEGRLEECDGCGRRFSTGGALGKHTWARMQNGGTCPVPRKLPKGERATAEMADANMPQESASSSPTSSAPAQITTDSNGRVTHIDGLALHLSDLCPTGYKHVYRNGDRFILRVPQTCGMLGSFSSAVEAAKQYAEMMSDPDGFVIASKRAIARDRADFTRRNEEEAERRGLARHKDGFKLMLAPFARSGYRYVYFDPGDAINPWNTSIETPQQVRIGHYRTEVEAAVAVARYCAEQYDDDWHMSRDPDRGGSYPFNPKGPTEEAQEQSHPSAGASSAGALSAGALSAGASSAGASRAAASSAGASNAGASGAGASSAGASNGGASPSGPSVGPGQPRLTKKGPRETGQKRESGWAREEGA